MKTKACAPAKHHYDECAERVTEQHEQHGKAHEDCVEECKSNPLPLPFRRHDYFILTVSTSFPPHALRHQLRRAQAFQAAAVNDTTYREPGATDHTLQFLLDE